MFTILFGYRYILMPTSHRQFMGSDALHVQDSIQSTCTIYIHTCSWAAAIGLVVYNGRTVSQTEEGSFGDYIIIVMQSVFN